jgi:hypothetical protein
MTKQQQRRFVRELARNITQNVLATSDRWPAHWDGQELRVLLSEHVAMSARMSRIYVDGRSGRARDYRNTVLVERLT